MASPVDLRLRVGMPLAVVALVVAGDFATGDNIVFGLLCAVPLLVAQVDGPRTVVAWGAVCIALELALGLVDGAYADADAVGAQAIRVAFAVFMTGAGAALSARRLRAEARLRRMTAVAVTAQRAVLRQLGEWALAGDYTGAYAESRVGGDLYDAQLTDHGLLVLAAIGWASSPGVQPAAHPHRARAQPAGAATGRRPRRPGRVRGRRRRGRTYATSRPPSAGACRRTRPGV